MSRAAPQLAEVAQDPINVALNLKPLQDGASTTSLGACYSASPLSVKNFFLASYLNLLFLSLKPFTHVLSLSNRVKS